MCKMYDEMYMQYATRNVYVTCNMSFLHELTIAFDLENPILHIAYTFHIPCYIFCQDYISVTTVLDRPEEASRGGWVFTSAEPDPVVGAKDLREVRVCARTHTHAKICVCVYMHRISPLTHYFLV
jgi:hypothetical protein